VAAICRVCLVLMVGVLCGCTVLQLVLPRHRFQRTTQVDLGPVSPLARKIAVLRCQCRARAALEIRTRADRNRDQIGEVVTVFYTVTNREKRTTTGQAAYNVAPLTVVRIFRRSTVSVSRTDHGCGERQMPVVFMSIPLVATAQR
jgi:cytochrome c oxidase assembly protein subunit 11